MSNEKIEYLNLELLMVFFLITKTVTFKSFQLLNVTVIIS